MYKRQVSIGPIVEELNVSATSVGTALVFYSLFVAAFVMVGAKPVSYTHLTLPTSGPV